MRLGRARAASRHFGKTTHFPWKRHVKIGKIVVIAWALGGLGGILMTVIIFGQIVPVSLHFKNALLVGLLLLVAYLTGKRLDSRPNTSEVLPVVHMTNNIMLLFLVAVQLITGIGILWGALRQ